MSMRRLWMIIGSIGFSLAAPLAAHAQALCASFPPTIVLTAKLDPFGASPAINQTVTYTITRLDSNAIDTVFVFVPEAPATTSTATISGVGNDPGDNSFSPMDVATAPTINVDSANGLKLNYAGQTGTASAQLTINIPAGANFVAGTNKLFYDVVFACKKNAGKTGTQTLTNALEIDFNEVSALKASIAGYPLDFGDITNVSTPSSKTAPISGNTVITVQSSGPYNLAINSANGYVMTQGGAAINGTHSNAVGYTLHFLGQNPSGTSSAPNGTPFTTTLCNPAGVTPGKQIPITATLNETTPGKLGGAYQDTLTFTFSPLGVGSGSTCGA